jgi:hypothetical protein
LIKSKKTKKNSSTTNTNYYCQNSIYEVIQVACEWGFQNNTFIFNSFKYLSRIGKKTIGKKNILKDLRKAKYYIEKEKEIIEMDSLNKTVMFQGSKLKSMSNEKIKLRQNVNLIMGEWGYSTRFDYHSSDNQKFFIVHKDLISIFKRLNNCYGILHMDREYYLIILDKMINRLDTMLNLMK